jgi:hypothetical protein
VGALLALIGSTLYFFGNLRFLFPLLSFCHLPSVSYKPQ